MAGELQDYTVDQAAGAIALTLGALGSLLLVIWQSQCLCRCRIGISDQCYLFDCSREPPPLDPEKPDEPSVPDTDDVTDEYSRQMQPDDALAKYTERRVRDAQAPVGSTDFDELDASDSDGEERMGHHHF